MDDPKLPQTTADEVTRLLAAAADRMGREGAVIMARAGLTREEGLHHLMRIGEMVFTQETQA